MKNRLKLDTGNLKNLIAQRRVRKTELALEIGVTRETFSRWLAGRVEYIEESKLLLLSERLECEPAMLSPEIAPGRRREASPILVDPVPGDDFIRMGLYSGLWKELVKLYDNGRQDDIVQDGKANVSLCRALHALLNLESSDLELWSAQPDPLQKNHEVFDVIARHHLTLVIARLLKGEISEAHRLCKLVSIQANREWVASAAYLFSGICFLVTGHGKEALEAWMRGLMSFPESQDDLALFMQANLRLAVSLVSAGKDPDGAWIQVREARRIFQNQGYRHGQARCLACEALLLAYEGRQAEAAHKVQDLLSLVHRLPRLHRIEVLLCMAGVSMLAGENDAARDQKETALALAGTSEVLANWVKNCGPQIAFRKAL